MRAYTRSHHSRCRRLHAPEAIGVPASFQNTLEVLEVREVVVAGASMALFSARSEHMVEWFDLFRWGVRLRVLRSGSARASPTGIAVAQDAV